MRVDDYCRAVIRSTTPPAPAQAVLWMLASYVNRHTGETFVSQQTIAADTGLSWRQVQRWTKTLAEAGVFAIVAATGRPNVYRFPIHPALSTTHDISVRPTHDTDDVGPTTFSAQTHDIQRANPRHVCRTNPLNREETRAAGSVDDEHDPTPGWFKDRLVRHIAAETVDVVDNFDGATPADGTAAG